MPTTKLIYGVGRIPKASEFALGEIIVNVDDSKVFSKSKSNVVFEIGGGGNNTTNNITEGDTITNISGFNTASISSSGFFTSADTSNLIISGGVGVSVTTGSNNQIIITATGDSEVTNAINAETASYVEVAQTASYVDTSNLDGTIFQLSNDGDQGGILFSENNINIFSTVGASAAGLSETDNVTFAQVSASGLLFASSSEETTGGDNIRAVVYDTASGRFYFTGSYGGGGGSTSTLQQVTDQGSSTTTAITASIISASGDIVANNISASGNFVLADNSRLQSENQDTTYIKLNGDDYWQVYANGLETAKFSSTQVVINELGQASVDFRVESDNDTHLLFTDAGAGKVTIGTNTPSDSLFTVARDITVQRHITASGDISSSGLLFASASQPTHADSIVAVVYDTGSGRFYYTGSYTNLSKGDPNKVPFYDSSGNVDTSINLAFQDFAIPGVNNGYRQFSVGVGNNGRIRTETGFFQTAITSSVYRHSNNPIQINSDYSRIAFGNNKIDFRVFGEGFDYKGTRMSLNKTELRIGSHSNNQYGAFAELSPVDVIVTGSINTTNYIRLDSTGSNTVVSAIAGALMYSASNEFYLGFS